VLKTSAIVRPTKYRKGLASHRGGSTWVIVGTADGAGGATIAGSMRRLSAMITMVFKFSFRCTD
jgi:hypothetical protein